MTRRLTTTGGALAALLSAVGLTACGGASPAASVTLSASVKSATSSVVAISPQPGTPDASPATQISFLGAAGTQVSAVRAVGSRSGVHSGVVRSYSTGEGASFVPSHPFRVGEKVTVHAQVGTVAVGTSFTIAHQAAVSQKEFPLNPGDPRAIQHYSSAPSLTPSTVRITTKAKPGAAPGDLFLAPYQGKPALVWWQGRIIQVGFGEGEDVIYDSSYHRIATVRAGNGYRADLHEIRITPQGTAWIDVFDPIHMNLSSVHGPANGIITDSVVQ